jgi:hypothetical protein
MHRALAEPGACVWAGRAGAANTPRQAGTALAGDHVVRRAMDLPKGVSTGPGGIARPALMRAIAGADVCKTHKCRKKGWT